MFLKIKIFIKTVMMFIYVITDVFTVGRMAYIEHPLWDLAKSIWQNCYNIVVDEEELG